MKHYKIAGHTVLDRVILTCWQTPLVVKYLAECMIKALNYTQKDLSFLDNNKVNILIIQYINVTIKISRIF